MFYRSFDSKIKPVFQMQNYDTFMRFFFHFLRWTSKIFTSNLIVCVGSSIFVRLILRHVRNEEGVELNGSYVHNHVEIFPYVAFYVIGFCSYVPGR